MRRGVIGAVMALAIAAASCGKSSNPATPTASAPPSNVATITIVGQKGSQSFSPNPAAVGGQSVVFKNSDTVTHRVVLNDGSVDTGDNPPGGTSRTVTMPAAGTNYHCSIHPGMIGSVNPASGGAPPPCEGPYCNGY